MTKPKKPRARASAKAKDEEPQMTAPPTTREEVMVQLNEFVNKLTVFIQTDRAVRGAPPVFYRMALQMAVGSTELAMFLENLRFRAEEPKVVMPAKKLDLTYIN